METRYHTPVRQGSRIRNPFAELNRDNFPGWDRALESNGKGRATQQLYNEERVDLDRSVCSQASSSFHTSTMDMSIGARAAMTEHLRYIALHGLDGYGNQCDTPGSHSLLPHDEIWDRLMDGDKVSMTSSSSPWDRRSVASSSLWDRLELVMSTGQDGTEAVEVAADLSDYFNSTEVWQLSTPEKNKGMRRAITTRGDNELFHYEESDCGSGRSQGSGMMYLYNAALGMQENFESSEDTNSSFVSLGVDLSRISDSDISDIRSSPDESFQQRMKNCFGDDIRDSLPWADVTPSRMSSCRDVSYSTPLQSPPKPSSDGPIFNSRIPVGRTEKENASNFSDIALSPIAAQAGSIAMKLGRPSKRDYPCAAFPDGDFVSPGLAGIMYGLRIDEPSPISQANQSFSDLRSFPIGENCILDMDSCVSEENEGSIKPSISRTPPGLKPRENVARLSHGSSSSTSCAKTSSGSSGIDRRRYRTVVPARVFFDEPNDFPDHGDSFSARSEMVATSSSDYSAASRACLPSRSLLDSFDAIQEYQVPLKDF